MCRNEIEMNQFQIGVAQLLFCFIDRSLQLLRNREVTAHIHFILELSDSAFMKCHTLYRHLVTS